jgi:hypothetical protein
MMRRLACSCLLATAFPLLTSAADENGPVPASKREHDRSLGQISVIDKFLAIEAAIGPRMHPPKLTDAQWAADYKKLYDQFKVNAQLSALPNGGKVDVITPLALGIKASDAVLALKAHNVEELNRCAEQIEQLAIKLGATKKELGMADTVKRYANDSRWLDAFLALGFLQRSVLNYLKEHEDRKDEATLVVVGGWLQGGRCVSHIIAQNYTPEVSNILRDPRLVDLLKANMDALPPKYISQPIVSKINGLLPEIRKRVAVGFRDPVKEADVKWLHETFNDLVLEITTGQGGAEKKTGAQ